MTNSARVMMAVAALAALPGLGAAQQSDDQWLQDCNRNSTRSQRVNACEVRVSTLAAPNGPIRVSPGQNGGISIEGWSGSGIEVHARIQGQAATGTAAAAMADAVQIGTNGTITASGPESTRDASWNVNFVVFVPASSDIELTTHNGPLSVRGVTGTMALETTNGPLALRDVGGNVRARTTNGPLSVTLSGTSWRGAGLDAETSNGPVILTVPDGFNAQLEAGSNNGPFDSNLGIDVPSFRNLRRGPISATLGNGGPTIRLVTSNGPVSLRRSNQHF
jgi:DUF4097 and DUF4098 domain-containing protein YvlB